MLIVNLIDNEIETLFLESHVLNRLVAVCPGKIRTDGNNSA